LDTDASDKAVGAVLSQQIDDNEHVIAYMSKAFNKHETSYCTTRKELFAVITALKKFSLLHLWTECITSHRQCSCQLDEKPQKPYRTSGKMVTRTRYI
jgi:hypothetical protein